MQGEEWLGNPFGNRRSATAEFVTPKHGGLWKEQPLMGGRLKRAWNGSEPTGCLRRDRLNEPDPRHFVTQRSADFVLIRIHGLDGIPAGSPKLGNQR
jgi:hypothetical protein